MIDFINIYSVPNFKEHKNNLINLIKKMPVKEITNTGASISGQDWNIDSNFKREYLEYFEKKIFNDFLKVFCSKYNAPKVICKNLWFQIYDKNDFHEIHMHENCHFANIFYIKLPKDLETKIYNIDNRLIDMYVKEGDIISFPAFLKHEAPKNKNGEKKIIISFNLDLTTV